MYEDSKRKLSKTVAELERKLQEEQKKNSWLVHQTNQSTANMEKYKQKFNNLNKLVQNKEIDK